MEVQMDHVSGVHHHHHHQQEISSQTLESMLVCTKAQQDKKPRPPDQEALKCPRCDSSNTKFCYYNNYSLTQPRYFCKSCRRYWTKGGTLRNVPVGGGCRRNKRSSSSSSATSSNSTSSSAIRNHHLIQQNHPLNIITSSNANNHNILSGLTHHLPYDSTSTDLSLAFARLQNQANGPMGYDHFDHNDHFLDAIRNGGFLENTNNTFHNVLFNNGGNIGNLIINHDQDQQVMNPMFNQDMITCGETTTVKQETCNMMRSSSDHHQNHVGDSRSGGGVLWGFPWQMDQGNMVHEVESSGRSQIGGWNGIGSTNWHGLINSPLM